MLQAACARPRETSIALDGKTPRGSFDNFHDRVAAQALSALATDTALLLAHVDIADKSNEIPAVQDLLAELGIARHLVTLDALHCQKTFEIAATANIALIVQIKDKQRTLHRQIQDICDNTTPLTCVRSLDKTARNRQETRVVAVFDPLDKLSSSEWSAHVAAIVRVDRNVLTRSAKTGLWQPSTHAAEYLSNTSITAARAGEVIRAHWAVENTSHYTRAVTMDEDRSRIRSNPGVFTIAPVSPSTRHGSHSEMAESNSIPIDPKNSTANSLCNGCASRAARWP